MQLSAGGMLVGAMLMLWNDDGIVGAPGAQNAVRCISLIKVTLSSPNSGQ